MENNLTKELDSLEKKRLGLVLDTGAIEGLKKMPVDVFDNIYLGEAHNNALVLCVDVRNFSDFYVQTRKKLFSNLSRNTHRTFYPVLINLGMAVHITS